MEDLQFGIEYDGGYHGSLPKYFDPAKFPQLQVLKDNWVLIRDELYTSQRFKSLNTSRASSSGGWKGMYLLNYGLNYRSNRESLPILNRVLEQIPDVVFAAFSVLEPNSRLEPHWGDSNTTIRCVLGIEVPGLQPKCGLVVGGEMRSWKEGELLLFSECHLHSAINETDKRRIVLSVDILHPDLRKQKTEICATVLACQAVAQIRELTGLNKSNTAKALIIIVAFFWRVLILLFKQTRWVSLSDSAD